jgi:hypothetical protein
MASEKRGYAYEALTMWALGKLKEKGEMKHDAFWNQKPDNLGIVPDITIGRNPSEPSSLILVSHCTAEHNSDMKFWRNVGEVWDAKRAFGPDFPCRCLLFDAKFKKNLLIIQKYAFDAFLCVGHQTYASELLQLGDHFNDKFPSDQTERISAIQGYIGHNPSARLAARLFLDDLRNWLNSSLPQSGALWRQACLTMSHRDPAMTSRRVVESNLRRGLAKLLFFERVDNIDPRTMRVKSGAHYFCGERVDKAAIVDEDLRSLFNVFDLELLKELHEKYSSETAVKILIEPLRKQDWLKSAWQFLVDRWEKMTSGDSLFQVIHDLSNPPRNAKHNDWPKDLPGWLIVLIISLLKVMLNGRMAYGYSVIVNRIEEMSNAELLELRRQYCAMSGAKLATVRLRSSRTIEYGLRDWLYGEARDNFSLLESELFVVCTVIARDLSKLTKESLSDEIGAKTISWLIDDTIETKLLSHAGFRPLKDLLVSALELKQISFEDVSYWQTELRHLAVGDGEKVNIRAGSTNVLKVQRTIIRWISMSEDGRDHKVKEFCGKVGLWRAASTQRVFHSDRFEPITRFLMLVDGNLRDDDVKTLLKAGWDGVYFPTEIERLIGDLR